MNQNADDEDAISNLAQIAIDANESSESWDDDEEFVECTVKLSVAA